MINYSHVLYIGAAELNSFYDWKSVPFEYLPIFPAPSPW